ncbi:rho-related_GTP-binding protein [Hexamita inflata]|uniref:Rho-related GTP-binding protein n=1 Tax=Hexamita inflata TaxID=28002 RepID=A0AA86VSE8_9EUKA|nr:rho-related GTP-binding protein [Hexamita inflata]
MKQYKFTFVGDSNTEKSNFLYRLYQSYDSQIQSAFQSSYVYNCTVNGQQIKYELQDTPCQDDFNHMRYLYYFKTDVFVICYQHISGVQNWVLEIQKQFKKAPIALLQLSSDTIQTQNGEITNIMRENKIKTHLKQNDENENQNFVIHELLQIAINEWNFQRK